LLNLHGVDLENDFTPLSDTDRYRQQVETSSVMEWMEQRSFLFGIELRGEDENFVVPSLPSETLRWMPRDCKNPSLMLGRHL
jgi:hypothetical protein